MILHFSESNLSIITSGVIKLVTSFLHVTASCNALRMVTQYMLMFLLGISLTSDEYCKCLLHTSPFQLNKPFESIFTLYSLVASTFWWRPPGPPTLVPGCSDITMHTAALRSVKGGKWVAWHAQTMGSIVASVQLVACSLSLSLLPHSTPFPLAVQPVPILFTSRLPVRSQTRQSELFEVQKQVNISSFSSSLYVMFRSGGLFIIIIENWTMVHFRHHKDMSGRHS